MMRAAIVLTVLLCLVPPPGRAQIPVGFKWVDLHGDKDVIQTVASILDKEPYTAIREIGLIGDAAFVVTAEREKGTTISYDDYIQVFSVSLKNKRAIRLVGGRNLELRDWYLFAPQRWDLVLTYQACSECEPTFMMTALHYDQSSNRWIVMWPDQGGDTPGIPMRSDDVDEDYQSQYVLAIFGGVNAPAHLGSWWHYLNLETKKQEDIVSEYWVDEKSGKNLHRSFTGTASSAFRLNLCKADAGGLSFGQDSQMCKQLLQPTRRSSPK